MASYTEYEPSIAPTQLQGPNGQAWLEVQGSTEDDVSTAAKQATKVHMPTAAVAQGSIDALALIGSRQERNLPRTYQPTITITTVVPGPIGVMTFNWGADDVSAPIGPVATMAGTFIFTFPGTTITATFAFGATFNGIYTINPDNSTVVPAPGAPGDLAATSLTQNDAQYAEYLREGWDVWSEAGTPLGMLLALEQAGYGAADGNPLIVTQLGRMFRLDADKTITPAQRRLIFVSSSIIPEVISGTTNCLLVSLDDTLTPTAERLAVPSGVNVTINFAGVNGVATFAYTIDAYAQATGKIVSLSGTGTTAATFSDTNFAALGLQLQFTSGAYVLNDEWNFNQLPGGAGPNPALVALEADGTPFVVAPNTINWWSFAMGGLPWPGPYPSGISGTSSGVDANGHLWDNRFGVIFQAPLPPGWTTTFVAGPFGLTNNTHPSLQEIDRIRSTIQTWQPAHTQCQWIKVWTTGLQWGSPGNTWGAGVWGGTGIEFSPVLGDTSVIT